MPLLDHGIVIGGHALDHGQVPAGGKGAAGPGDDRHRHRLVGVGDGPDLGQLAVKALVGGVEYLGPIDGDQEDPGRRAVEPEMPEFVPRGRRAGMHEVGHGAIIA